MGVMPPLQGEWNEERGKIVSWLLGDVCPWLLGLEGHSTDKEWIPNLSTKRGPRTTDSSFSQLHIA